MLPNICISYANICNLFRFKYCNFDRWLDTRFYRWYHENLMMLGMKKTCNNGILNECLSKHTKEKTYELVLFDRRITILHKYPLMLLLHAIILFWLQTEKTKWEDYYVYEGRWCTWCSRMWEGFLIFIRKKCIEKVRREQYETKTLPW